MYNTYLIFFGLKLHWFLHARMSVDWTYLPCHFMLSKLNCQAFAHFAQLTIFQWQKKNFQRNPNIKWLVIIYLIVSFSCHTEINIKEFIDLLIKAKLYNCNKLRFINSIIKKRPQIDWNIIVVLFSAVFCCCSYFKQSFANFSSNFLFTKCLFFV